MNKTKKILSDAGKKGAEIKHRHRYEMLVELSKLIDKKYQNRILKWPTEHLEILWKELIKTTK